MTKTNSSSPEFSFPLAFSFLIMGAIAMGASPVFVRFAEIGPFTSAFWRVFLAIPFLLIWVFWESRKSARAINWRFDNSLIFCGVLFAGDLIFWHLAIVNTTIANATLMATLAPVWVVLFSKTFIGEAVYRNSRIGLVVCLIGAMLLIGSSYRLAPERIVGDLYGLVTSMFFGLYFLSARVARRTHKAGELTLLSTIVTALILFGVALLSSDKMIPETGSGWASLFALGAFSHAGGQGLLAIALGSLSATFSSLVIFVEAVAAAILGWAIFSEELGPLQLAGGALIFLGVWVARPAKR